MHFIITYKFYIMETTVLHIAELIKYDIKIGEWKFTSQIQNYRTTNMHTYFDRIIHSKNISYFMLSKNENRSIRFHNFWKNFWNSTQGHTFITYSGIMWSVKHFTSHAYWAKLAQFDATGGTGFVCRHVKYIEAA